MRLNVNRCLTAERLFHWPTTAIRSRQNVNNSQCLTGQKFLKHFFTRMVRRFQPDKTNNFDNSTTYTASENLPEKTKCKYLYFLADLWSCPFYFTRCVVGLSLFIRLESLNRWYTRTVSTRNRSTIGYNSIPNLMLLQSLAV